MTRDKSGVSKIEASTCVRNKSDRTSSKTSASVKIVIRLDLIKTSKTPNCLIASTLRLFDPDMCAFPPTFDDILKFKKCTTHKIWNCSSLA